MTFKTFSWCASLVKLLFKFEGYSHKAERLRKSGDQKGFDEYVQMRVRNLAERLEKTAGLSYTVEGKENIPATGPIVYGCNHQSIFDTAVMVNHTRELSGFIMKKELSRIPLTQRWLGYFHCVYCERKNKKSSRHAYEAAVEQLRQGNSMIIFFEGTRSRDLLHDIGAFKTGAFRMAMETGAALVPVLICGTAKTFEDNKNIQPAVGKVKFLPPVHVPQMEHRELLKYVEAFREKFIVEYEKLRDETEALYKKE